jgi:uncharacterized SAM-binding protein YcdF (DUF218 family)
MSHNCGEMTYTEPLILTFLIVALVGLARLWRCRGSWLLIVGVGGILLISWPPVDWLVSRPLEARYPIRPLPSGPAEAIVVLSSAVSPPISQRPYSLPDRYTYERCEFAAWLHQHWRPVPVMACGGPRSGSQQAPSVTMRQLLQRAGVPELMIWTEERSRSTYENALFGAQILRKHGIVRIVLVVEAQCMPRAEACFRKQGIMVVAAPSEFREFEPGLGEFLPSWKAISRNENALHEVLGLAWYHFRGWT